MLPLIVGIEGESLSAAERELFARLQPAGYILFSRNVADAELCRELTDELRGISKHTPLICMDQEGGRVVRTAALGMQLPSARMLGASKDKQLITQAAFFCVRGLQQLGVNTNFAPVLDADLSELSTALKSRCWGQDPQDIISYAGIWNRAMMRQGIITCGKHFPGLGEAAVDPHFSLPVLRGDRAHFLEGAALPFMALMPELPSLMMAHMALPDLDADLPCSLSAAIVTDFLRGQLGYEGVIFTDDLCMGAISQSYSPAQSVVLALQAGCDLPLVCHEVLGVLEGVAEAIESQLEPMQLEAAMKRIEKLQAMAFTPEPLPFIAWRDWLAHSAEFNARFDSEQQALDSPVARY